MQGRHVLLILAIGIGLCSGKVLQAQTKQDPALLTIDRIFKSDEFSANSFGPARWLKKGGGYTVKEANAKIKGAHDIVRVDPATGKKEIMVSAAHLIPPGSSKPLTIESYKWSPNEAMVLIFTNSKRVWRQNTRGDFWVFDIASRELHKLGGEDAKASTLQFAKFSPNGRMAAYVRENDIYVEDLVANKISRLTKRTAPTIINGTFDWVYEEELGLRDGIRWSPDSSMIAYWQLDTKGVRDYHMIDNISGLYPKITTFKYPKAGHVNSACRIGVVRVNEKSPPRWLGAPGDSRNHYIARMDWAPLSKSSEQEIVFQQLNRSQNTNTIMFANAGRANEPRLRPGVVRLEDQFPIRVKMIHTERDKAWLDVHDTLHWFDNGNQFTWLSDRTGWRHIYAVSRDGTKIQPITSGKFDVFEDMVHVDENSGYVYYYASPTNATQKYLYRTKLTGGKAERVTPEQFTGWNSYDISPGGKWAMHTHSAFGTPPTTRLIELPSHKDVRVLAENGDLQKKLAKLKRGQSKFFKIDIGADARLDGWMMTPPNFDPKKKYPVLFYVYGEPAGQTVLDRWGRATSYLWYTMLTQKGYLVMSVDNRGTPAPRGRDFRKFVYRKIGIQAPKDQAAAVKAIRKRWPWVDGDRIGVWGWSGGGTMSLHAIFRYPELYKMAMSVAPVTNERFYDTIYQERYMGLPKDNVKGYRDGSPIKYAGQLKGHLLLVHGTADDNVHYANTEALVNELIAHNKQFSMMSYPNRSHSIREGRNTRRHLFTLLTRYLQNHLPAGAREGPAKTSKNDRIGEPGQDGHGPPSPIADLQGSRLTEYDFKQLADRRELHSINLAQTNVTARWLTHLAALPRLRYLDLRLTRITDNDLKVLQGFRNLVSLDLGGAKRITDKGTPALVKLKNLTELNLSYTSVTDDGLRHIGKMRQLRDLELQAVHMTDKGLKNIAALMELRTLRLRSEQIGDGGLRFVGGLKNLQHLLVSSPLVTDQGLKHLRDLKQLRTVLLAGCTRITAGGIEDLQRALPNTLIETVD